MKKRAILAAVTLVLLNRSVYPADKQPEWVEMSADVLEDKIRGGLLGQILGNLNGLPHENKYCQDPGAVTDYTPSLPEGAWTDDDTDIEWVYITEMDRSGKVLLAPARIRELWTKHINRGIFCANAYARELMKLGMEPPLTGRIAVNPWSVFNISGQFICESFGLIAPAMPQTASRIGMHYTHVAIDGEPTQQTQLCATMIAVAFVEDDLQKILEAGLDATDPASTVHTLTRDVQRWWNEHPDDWKATRLAIKKKYMHHNCEVRDMNGYELNTASTIGALLYGKGDPAETLRMAFNFGWDADNNAATAATIVGIIKGRRWMDAQGWKIKDAYRNTTRDAMPGDETITGFGDKLVALARRVILEQGGEAMEINGKPGLRIRREQPAVLAKLPRPLDRSDELPAQLTNQLERDIRGAESGRASAAYLAVSLGLADEFARRMPVEWPAAIEALKRHPRILFAVFTSPEPSGQTLKKRFQAAGLTKPDQLPEH